MFVIKKYGAPKTATTEDNTTKIYDLVLLEVAETVGILKNRVGHILLEILGMRKLSARWVPRLFTANNKCNRKTTSEHCFCIVCRPSMKHGSTGTHQIPRNSRNNGFTRRTCSEEGEDCPMVWKGDGNHFLGLTRYDLH
ncbi:unnamed protein product [Euphydryas editha]|uniref:Uncharacterized protein n=1 Tax=Euphydryas editha TaxID=104508 RepID=A0AAU9V7E4_EUPED|nr:unnamed protein product [Euphydryas editha]